MSETKNKSILILSADAGFGHRSAAIAIQTALERLDEGYMVHLVNPLDEPRTPPFLRNTQSDYDAVIRKAPELYNLGYKASDHTIPRAMMDSSMIVMLYETMARIMRSTEPDLIIMTFPLYLAPLEAIFTITGQRIPIFTVITDLGMVHRVWFHPTASLTLVPTQKVYDLAIEQGMHPDATRIVGIPVHPRIAEETRPAEVIRKELGWNPDLTTVLAVSSKRVGNVLPGLHALNHANLPIQLVVVAGGDDDFFEKASQMEWHLPMHLYNFVDDMPVFMRAADMIICKAGGLITTEALACGLPLLLVDVLPGQEEGNAEYVIQGEAGTLVKTPMDMLETTFHWLMDDGALLKERSAHATRLGHAGSAMEIARLAKETLDGTMTFPERNVLPTLPTFSELLDRFDIPWRSGV